MIRARLRDHLQHLKRRFESLLSECEILESRDADYAVRLLVPKRVWRQILAELADETDYDNFKAEVARYQRNSRRRYEPSLHEVWSVMYRLQKG